MDNLSIDNRPKRKQIDYWELPTWIDFRKCWYPYLAPSILQKDSITLPASASNVWAPANTGAYHEGLSLNSSSISTILLLSNCSLGTNIVGNNYIPTLQWITFQNEQTWELDMAPTYVRTSLGEPKLYWRELGTGQVRWRRTSGLNRVFSILRR